MNEMIGQSDRIKVVRPNKKNWKLRGLDFTELLAKPEPAFGTKLYRCTEQEHGLEKQIDNELIKKAAPALERGESVQIEMPVMNTNRTVGTMLSGEVARRYGEEGLPDATIQITMRGMAGQSFGTFLAKGIELKLYGQANDYVGKGLSGGRLIIRVPEDCTIEPTENIIIGNTCLYGATSGEAYFNGVAGERFAVRNSGARAVVEGVGDHGCEYMTGGRVVVLGKTGRNFAAGMSGGIAYVWDPKKAFRDCVNPEMVDLDPVDMDDAEELRQMIEAHHEATDSERARTILENWDTELKSFVKVIPGDYKLALAKLEEKKDLELDGSAA